MHQGGADRWARSPPGGTRRAQWHRRCPQDDPLASLAGNFRAGDDDDDPDVNADHDALRGGDPFAVVNSRALERGLFLEQIRLGCCPGVVPSDSTAGDVMFLGSTSELQRN